MDTNIKFNSDSLENFLNHCAQLKVFNKERDSLYFSLYKNDISATDLTTSYIYVKTYNNMGSWWNCWSKDFAVFWKLTDKAWHYVKEELAEGRIEPKKFREAIEGLKIVEQGYSHAPYEHYFIQMAIENLQRAAVALGKKNDSGNYLIIDDEGNESAQEPEPSHTAENKTTGFVNIRVVDKLKSDLFPYRSEENSAELKSMVRNYFFDIKLLRTTILTSGEGDEITAPYQFSIDCTRMKSLSLNDDMIVDEANEINSYDVSKKLIDHFGQEIFQKIGIVATQYYDWGFAQSAMKSIPTFLKESFTVQNYFVNVTTVDKYQFTIHEEDDRLIIRGKTIFQIKDSGKKIVDNPEMTIGYVAFDQEVILSKAELQNDFSKMAKDEILPSMQVSRRLSVLSTTSEAAVDNLLYYHPE